ncbi:MAG: dTMP kinase [Candidatus Lokiarchaeota archaeon]|nr:dTMP kinase [Candidatus Lokiarchaeota archaeon]
MQHSIFIVLDGIDGSGTSTHSKLLAGFLSLKGLNVYITQEPSNSDIGKLLRTYLKDDRIPASTDALLFAADRVIHFENEIKEKLEEGYIVISDRYIESSIAYQSSQSEKLTIDWVKDLNKFAGKPDLTIILDIDPKLSIARKHHKVLDKFEDTSLLEKVRQVYLNRAKNEGYCVIYTDDIIEIVQAKIQEVVIEKLDQRGIQIKK